MRNEIYNYVTSIDSLIDRSLRRSVHLHILCSALASQFILNLPKGCNPVLSVPYSPLTIHHSQS